MSEYQVVFTGNFIENASAESVKKFFIGRGKDEAFVNSILKPNCVILKTNDKSKAESTCSQFKAIGMDVVFNEVKLENDKQVKKTGKALYIEEFSWLRHITEIATKEDVKINTFVSFYDDKMSFLDVKDNEVFIEYSDIEQIINVKTEVITYTDVFIIVLKDGTDYIFGIRFFSKSDGAKAFEYLEKKNLVPFSDYDEKKHEIIYNRNYEPSVFKPEGLVRLYKEIVVFIVYFVFIVIGYMAFFVLGVSETSLIFAVIAGIANILFFGFILMFINIDNNISKICKLLEEIHKKNTIEK